METPDLEQSSGFIERCNSTDCSSFADSTNYMRSPFLPCNPEGSFLWRNRVINQNPHNR
jgi:hypothetical protein